MSNTALVLLGHGSHISPETAGVVWEQVDCLRAAGAADEVTAAFWKEAPSFATVLNTVVGRDVTLVPLFTARGYFTQTVIVAEMGLQGEETTQSGKHIRYTPTLGEHPAIADLVRRRAEDAIRQIEQDAGTSPEQIAVALIGHSTRRNPESRRATEAQAAHLRSLHLAAEVVAVYLDDTPDIPSIYDCTTAPTVIAIPYFLAFGSHVSLDVPSELGLPPGAMSGVVNGRTVVYTPPLNDADAITSMIRDLVGVNTSAEPNADVWSGFPQVGRSEFTDLLTIDRRDLRERDFGGLHIAPVPDGWRVTAKDDVNAVQRLHTPGDVRRAVRGNTPENFRPLPTSRDLPGGWFVEVNTPDAVHAVVETVYPGAVAEWALASGGLLPVHSLDGVIVRQTGMYRRLATLSEAERSELVAAVCGGCVRAPTWAADAKGETHPIPCPEACNWWMTRALEHLEGAQKADAS